MDENNVNNSYPQSWDVPVAEPLSVYTAKTFLWMFLGLLTTFGVAIGFYLSGLIWVTLSIPFFQLGLLVAELAVVLVLSARIHKLSLTAARVLFFGYAILNGIVFSTYFVIFQVQSLVLVFGATALYFGGMAVFGYVTKIDLSRMRTFLMFGLLGLIIFGVIGFFLPLGAFEKLYCMIGIVIFLGFTAYDTQKIKALHAAYGHDPEMAGKASIFSALQLYLDFINLFLYLLRIFGKRSR